MPEILRFATTKSINTVSQCAAPGRGRPDVTNQEKPGKPTQDCGIVQAEPEEGRGGLRELRG